MKYFNIPAVFLIVLLLQWHSDSTGKSVPVMQWKPGLYAEYIERFSPESGSKYGWAGYRFTLKEKTAEGLWRMEMNAKSSSFEYLYNFEVREPGKTSLNDDKESDITNVMITPWRNGAADDTELIQKRTENLFYGLKLLFSGKTAESGKKPAQSEFPYGIRITGTAGTSGENPPHKEYFFFSSDVPIFGIAGIKTSDGSSTLRIASFGNTAENLKNSRIQSYINFENREKIHYGDFHIDIPATWFLQEIKNGTPGAKLYKGSAGGKDLNAEISILYRTGITPADVTSQIKLFGKNISGDKIIYRFLRSDGYEDATHNAKFFYHLYEYKGETGFSVTGILSSKKGDRMAMPRIIVHFAKGNPLADNATDYLKKCSDIVRSFRIEGL